MNFGQVQGVWVFEILRIRDIEKIHKRCLIGFVCAINEMPNIDFALTQLNRYLYDTRLKCKSARYQLEFVMTFLF